MALILWSGGMDSTLLLYDFLSAKIVDGRRKGRYVDVHDIMVPILKKRFSCGFEHGEVTIKRKGIEILGIEHGLVQPQLWLCHASSYLWPNEDLYSGYIKGDDFWHYQGWMYEAFSNIQSIAYRTGKIKFPLEWTSKAEVIHRMRKARLQKYAWYCELSENGRPCKKCFSCTTHATAVWRLKEGIEEILDQAVVENQS